MTFHAKDAQSNLAVAFATETDPLGSDNVEVVTVTKRGTYGYSAGTGNTTVNVPAGGLLQSVTVIGNKSSATTVTIGGGNTITLDVGGDFDREIPGALVAPAIVIGGGTAVSYYIDWVS